MSLEAHNKLVLYAADVLGDIAFDGITQFESADHQALAKSMQTPNGSWDNAALCLKEPDSKLFTKERGKGTRADALREVCGRCMVRAQCMLDTLAGSNPEIMSAGLTSKQFFMLRRHALGLPVRASHEQSVVRINSLAAEITRTPEIE